MDLNQLKKARSIRVPAPSAPAAPSALAEKLAQAPSPPQPLVVMSDEDAAKAVMAMRLAGHTYREIAEELGCSQNQVRRLLMINAPKRKVFEDIIDGRALPAAIDNLIVGLEAGDKDYTIKTLEGRGLLVKHSHQEGQAPKSAFQFNIVVESPAEGHREPLLGAIVGEPRQLDSGNE